MSCELFFISVSSFETSFITVAQYRDITSHEDFLAENVIALCNVYSCIYKFLNKICHKFEVSLILFAIWQA